MLLDNKKKVQIKTVTPIKHKSRCNHIQFFLTTMNHSACILKNKSADKIYVQSRTSQYCIFESITRHKTRTSSVTPKMKYIYTIKHHYLNLWTHYLLLSTKASSRYKKIDLLICEWNWFINLPLYIYFTLFENFVGLVVCSCINKKKTNLSIYSPNSVQHGDFFSPTLMEKVKLI